MEFVASSSFIDSLKINSCFVLYIVVIMSYKDLYKSTLPLIRLLE